MEDYHQVTKCRAHQPVSGHLEAQYLPSGWYLGRDSYNSNSPKGNNNLKQIVLVVMCLWLNNLQLLVTCEAMGCCSTVFEA